MSVRAEIVETANPKVKSASIIINAPVAKIVSVVANPHMHAVKIGRAHV